MTRNLHSVRLGLPSFLVVLVALPFLMGQGCGTTGLIPVTPTGTLGDTTTPTSTGNASPFFEFIEPATDISVEIGSIVTIQWSDSDPDNNAAISLLADPDNIIGNGNERVILALALENDTANLFDLDTTTLPEGTYRIIARVNDGVNPELVAVAPGRLLLLGTGVLPGNKSPVVLMTDPDVNLALAQGDQVTLGYCGGDVDDGLNNTIPDVVIILDTDQNPTNDLDFTGPNRESLLLTACNPGPFPREVSGVLVLGCAKDNDCVIQPNGNVINSTPFLLTEDVGLVPPLAGGKPYWPRVTMWDHTNAPVHAYSRGNISITSLGSGTIDLGEVGKTISGTRMVGFDAGALTGSNASSIGDLNDDGAGDFVLVSRLGRGFEAGNTGTAYVIMGRPDEKYGNEFSVNSVGTLYPGSILTLPASTNTQGIVSVCQVTDIDGDNHSEIVFGMPFIEALYDTIPDDLHHCPCDQSIGCYLDLLPNPWSAAIPDCTDTDEMGAFDHREVVGCSNDLDLIQQTPINGGYAILVSSRNPIGGFDPVTGQGFVGVVRSLGDMGQAGPAGAPVGARWRGAWYESDASQTRFPYSIVPDNQFGQTVNSMPVMVQPFLTQTPDFGSELLVSAPNAFGGRGGIFLMLGQDWTRFFAGVESFPVYTDPGGACPPEQVSRGLLYPGYDTILGAAPGDNLGYAAAAGDYNLDGNRDIAMGAPGATRLGKRAIGIVYILFGRADFPGTMDLALVDPPRMEIRGINIDDQFGLMQRIVGDINQDGLPDIGFSSQYWDGEGGVDSGYIGVIFGGRRNTAEKSFTVNQVGTAELPGVKFYGNQPGGHAGAVINNAGDFNGDGTDDMVICAPDEIRQLNGLNRRGVSYVIFGGPHLTKQEAFNLSQVGTDVLPGVIIISPYVVGSADEAPTDWIGAVGDVNGDGFSDIVVGVSRADFVNPLSPTQRRVDAGEAYLIYGNNTGSNRIGG